jgi:hypothetical protein
MNRDSSMGRKIYYKFTLLLSMAFCHLETSSAQENDVQAPGLPIARLALPTISSNVDTLVPTKTLVGSKVAEMKKMLQELQGKIEPVINKTRQEYESIILEANQYHKIVGDIEAKLQLGTTPANPQLVALRGEASQQLVQITHMLGKLGDLSQEFQNFSQQTQSMSSQVQQTLVLPGAVDEDHAQLILIRQELDQLNGKICQILSVMVANIWRQGQWLADEQLRFEDLSLAVESGRFMMSSPRMAQAPTEIIALEPLPLSSSHPHRKPSYAPKKPSKPVSTSSKKKASPKKLEPQAPLVPSSPPKEAPVPGKALPQAPTVQPSSSKEEPAPRKTPPQASAPPPSSPKEAPVPGKEEPQTSTTPIKPLAPVAVESRPKIPPATQEAPPSPFPEKAQSGASMTDYAMAANGRSPLGILNADEDIQKHKWYLFSSAKSGLTTPSDIIDVVSIESEKSPSKRGEEVKDILSNLGLKSEQIRVIHAIGGEFDQVGKIYIFGQ